MNKKLFIFLTLIFILTIAPIHAFIRNGAGGATGSFTSFNGGKFQVNPNFAGISGGYEFVNYLKNSNGNWDWPDNTGYPPPNEMDAFGYVIPGTSTLISHSGTRVPVLIPAEAYIGNNCVPAQTGICFSTLVNGKGTVAQFGTIITSGATGTVATGATTTITFSSPQDFRAGMEVPVTGTNGTVSPNLTTGGATGAYTVCAAGLSSTTIQLCLNDQTTALATTGSFTGFATVSYGRSAVGVSAKGRIVGLVTGSPKTINFLITAQDATTPITYRNGLDGVAIVTQGSEEVRYEQWRAGTCPGGYNPACQFGAAHLAKLKTGNPGVIRHLNTINTNSSLETKWTDRKPVGYYSNSAYLYDRPISVFAGMTTSSLTDYSINFSSGAPVDKQQISLSFDATPVTVTSGANALVTWTGHGLSTGTPFNFFFTPGGSAPSGVTASTVPYYAITSCGGACDANHIRFATSAALAVAGTAVTTSSTGSNVLAHATVVATTAVLTNSSSTIQWNDPLIQVGDQISLACIECLPYPFNNGVSYFVTSVNAVTSTKADITISKTSGGAAIVACSSCGRTHNGVKNPTLNLNSTGPIAIKDANGWGVNTVRFGVSQPTARTSGGNLLYGTLTYDKVLNVWTKVGADNDFGNQLFMSGWPVETSLEYCIAAGAHCYFIPPRHTVDGDTVLPDYNPNLYTYVKNNAPPWMIPRFEIACNELWNHQVDFGCSNLMYDHAAVYADTAGWSQNSGYHQIVGKIASVLGQAVNNAYGNPTINGSKYWSIIGVQTFNFSDGTGATTNAPRVTSADYVVQSSAPPTGYAKSAARLWATHTASAQYWSPGYTGTFVADTLAAANAGGTITGSISGTSLTVSSVNVVTSPVFGIGSKLIQGAGITTATVMSGTNPYTLDVNLGTIGAFTDISYVASGYDATAAKTYIDSSITSASFTGVLATGTLTASSVTGFITNGAGSGGDVLAGTGVTSFTHIQAQLTGTGGASCPDVTCTGKAGTYSTSGSQTLSSRAMTTSGVFSITNNVIMNNAVFAFAQTYANSSGALLGMTGYEGTYSPDYATFNGANIKDQLYADGKLVISSPGSATGIYGYQATALNNFKTAGGVFPSQFNFTGLSPSGNAWSAIEDLYQPAPTPIWDAYKDCAANGNC